MTTLANRPEIETTRIPSGHACATVAIYVAQCIYNIPAAEVIDPDTRYTRARAVALALCGKLGFPQDVIASIFGADADSVSDAEDYVESLRTLNPSFARSFAQMYGSAQSLTAPLVTVIRKETRDPLALFGGEPAHAAGGV